METLKIKALIAKMSMQGVQISPDVLNIILKHNNAVNILEEVINRLSCMEEKPLMITPEVISDIIKINHSEEEFIHASNIPEDIEVVFEPTEHILSKSLSKDFKNYFISRYLHLKKILLTERFDVKGAIDIAKINNIKNKKDIFGNTIKIICIISEKHIGKNHITFSVEDLTGSISVIVPEKNIDLFRKAQRILLNEVVCIEGKILNEGIIVATDIIQPELTKPSNNTNVKQTMYAVLISDLHIGSRYFMRNAFNRFLLWLNGVLGDEKIRRIARCVKYLIVAGDIVDGIGVYPNQEKELAIKDLKKQYEVAAYYFSQIPQHIKVIIIPGNHDATRQALPSTALYKEYAYPLYKLDNVIILGDPAYVKLHGSLFLITHGKSLDDIMLNIPELKYDTPAKAMVELLRRRHIAPVYGGQTLIAPEEEDYMIITKTPHVFHAGHLHTFEYTYYKGVTVVNSGTWQEQTEYMKKMGIYPDPAKAVIINLCNNTVQSVINFKEEKEEVSIYEGF
ncbi:MAG: DNA-directed DNA polymerase II small subunit [Candidatus Methanomethylicia archaeon]